MNDEKIRLGISTCLLGHPVRYDGGHKKDAFLVNTLGQFVDYVPVCPEAECGMGTPRESLRLEGDPEHPRLMTHKTRRDLTAMEEEWGRKKLLELEKQNLHGYIFKSKSPSSGMERVKVYLGNGQAVKKGVGIWARMFMDHFPLLPVEEEGRLHDAVLRENFIERIFVMKRWRDYLQEDGSKGGLVSFHTQHKLLLMAHSPEHYRELGKLVADLGNKSAATVHDAYAQLLMDGLQRKATARKNVNVLQHIMGYFKKQLSPAEKKELIDIIGQYRSSNIPLIVPVTLLRHYVALYNNEYLAGQIYLHPHPVELKLRNHC